MDFEKTFGYQQESAISQVYQLGNPIKMFLGKGVGHRKKLQSQTINEYCSAREVAAAHINNIMDPECHMLKKFYLTYLLICGNLKYNSSISRIFYFVDSSLKMILFNTSFVIYEKQEILKNC